MIPRAVAGAIKKFPTTLFFIATFALTNYIYFIVLHHDLWNCYIPPPPGLSYPAGACNLVFLGSPFLTFESFNFGGGSMLVGLLWNFALVAFLICIAEGMEWVHPNGLPVSVKTVFAASVIAIYLVSVMTWTMYGVPGTGTSTIGFTAGVYAALLAAQYLYTMVRQHDMVANIMMYGVALVLYAAPIIWLYLTGNASTGYHIVGLDLAASVLVVFVGLASLWRAVKKVLV